MLPDGHYELKSFATDDKRANIIAYTAFGKRTAPYLLSYDSCWGDRAQSDAVVQWTRDQIEAAKPYSPGGSYLNFPGSAPIRRPSGRPTEPTMTVWPRSRQSTTR